MGEIRDRMNKYVGTEDSSGGGEQWTNSSIKIQRKQHVSKELTYPEYDYI